MTTTATLQRGDLVPHFTLRSVNGEDISYKSIWQTEQLVLIALPAAHSPAVDRYVSSIAARKDEFAANQTTCVVTRDRVEGLPPPAVVVADRWGEIAYVSRGRDVTDLPSADELVDWIQYVQRKCPECEGEAF